MESPSPAAPNYQLLLATVSKVIFAMGALVLVGWALEVDVLKRVVPGLPAMNPVTALCFMLLGVALECLRRPDAGTVRQLIGFALAVIVACLGGTKLASYLFGIPIRLDAILFRLSLHEAELRIPNQMAPNSASNFVLSGVALCLLDAKSRRFPLCNLLALAVVGTSMLALAGYAYGVTQLTRVSTVFIPMALPTAIAFLLLAVAILFARPDAPLARLFVMHGPARLVAVRLFPVVTLFVFCAGWLRLYGERAGYFPGALGTALFVVIIIFTLVGLVWWTASTLDKVEISRRLAEQQLAHSTQALEVSLQHLQLVMNHASELICSLDQDGKILSLNEASVPLLGLNPAQLLGRNFAEFVHPEERSQIAAMFGQVKNGRHLPAFKHRLRRRDGSFVELEWSFQWSDYHRNMFGVARAVAGSRSLQPWESAS